MGTYGVQMQGMMQMGNQMKGNQMMGMNGGNWWGMETEEDKEAYLPGMSEAYDLSELDGVDLNNEEAVAQRMATLSEQDQIKLFFTSMVMTTCDAVKVYIGQLRQWEQQYNFMGM